MDDVEDNALNFNLISVSTVCPLTKDLLKEPVRSLRCFPHDAFEKENIEELVKAYDGLLLCPICNHPITLEDLMPDDELKDFLEKNVDHLSRGVLYDLEKGEYFLSEEEENSLRRQPEKL
jgi:hypothetical protein